MKLPLVLLAIATQAVWGITPSASRLVLEHLPVEAYAAIRYTVAGILCLTTTLVLSRRLHVRLKDLPKLAAIGVLGYGLDSLGTLHGLRIGGVMNFALASSLNAVITAAVAIVILKERVHRSFVLGAALSVVGGVLLAVGKYGVSGRDLALTSLGLIWGAYLLEALAFVGSKRFKDRLPLIEYLAILQLSAAVFLWGICLGTGVSPAPLLAMPAKALLALAFVCVVSCCLCYFMLYWLLRRVDGHELAFYDCFHTLAAVVASALLFDERVSGAMVLGGALLALAVGFVARGRGQDKPLDIQLLGKEKRLA